MTGHPILLAPLLAVALASVQPIVSWVSNLTYALPRETSPLFGGEGPGEREKTVATYNWSYTTPPSTENATEGILVLRVENVRLATGKIWVGIYTSEADFMDREKARLEYVEVDATGTITLPIDALEPGKRYALAVFHDVNDNGELDLNWLGLPAEPWAFSGPVKTRFRLPRFEEVSFIFRAGSGERLLRLRRW